MFAAAACCWNGRCICFELVSEGCECREVGNSGDLGGLVREALDKFVGCRN